MFDIRYVLLVRGHRFILADRGRMEMRLIVGMYDVIC